MKAVRPMKDRGAVLHWENAKIARCCGCSSMAERQLPKLHTRVRFPSPAPPALASPPCPNLPDPRGCICRRRDERDQGSAADRRRRQHSAGGDARRQRDGRDLGGARPGLARLARPLARARDRQDGRHAAAVRQRRRRGGLRDGVPPRHGVAADAAGGARRTARRAGDPARERGRRHRPGREAARGRRTGQADRRPGDGPGPRRPDAALGRRPRRPRQDRPQAGLARALADQGRLRSDRAVRGRRAGRPVRAAVRRREGASRRLDGRLVAAGQRDPEQPALPGDVLHRPRARTGGGQAPARRIAPADPARHGRAGQDPPVAAGRGGADP